MTTWFAMRRSAGAALILASLVCVAAAPAVASRRALAVPEALGDREYWRIIQEFSEPEGFFQSENFVGNERPLQHVVPALEAMKGEGAYVGVAPDQNFTYIVALEPRIAFIVDIRRGNLLQHLMFKAVIELSPDRAAFLSHLFSRPRPRGIGETSSVVELLDAYWETAPDPDLHAAQFDAIWRHLTVTRGFTLTVEDRTRLSNVYDMFFRWGPALSYSPGTVRMPSYAEMAAATDLTGRHRGYLASEAAYGWLRDFQQRNLVVPIVGDFAGPHALRAVGAYLEAHGVIVRAFYTSNVEQYLFRNEAALSFYGNVAQLPHDERSVFIRSAYRRNVIDPIGDLLTAVREGRILEYWNVASRGTIQP